MITALLIGWPLVAGMLVLFLKGDTARRVALIASVMELAAALGVFYLYKQDMSNPQLRLDTPWIQSMGIHFHVAVNGISLVLVLLTTLLTPVIIFSSFRRTYDRAHLFYALILFMQMALVGVFVAADGFLFYIFWELALIPIWLICLLWGEGENRAKITFKFFVYTLAGSLLMLAAFIYVYQYTPTKSFSMHALYEAGSHLPLTNQIVVFWGIFLAFAIKMPIFPFHTWQPDTYVSSPMPGTMLLSGIMLKMGTYGLIMWLIPVVPAGAHASAPIAIGLSVISIVYASMMAIAQKDFKRLVAYSSIAHVGLISAGILSFAAMDNGDTQNTQGITGGIIQMMSHGITVIGLFLIADIISDRTGTREMGKLGGIRNVAPNFSVLFLVVLLGSVALPLTSGFIGEFLLITGVYKASAIAAGFAGLTIILGAVYMLRSYQTVMLGETNHTTASFGEVMGGDKAVLVVLAILIIALGVFPKPLIDVADPAVQQLIKSMHAIKP